MKYLLPILLFVSLSSLQAQKSLSTVFNSTHSGRSVILSGSKTFHQKHEIGMGLRFNINKIAHNDDQNNAFKKRLYATSFLQHWGIESYYHYNIRLKNEKFAPFLFYDIQLCYSQTRNRMYLPKLMHPDYGVMYAEIIDFFGPFTWLEQCLGFGFRAKINEHFSVVEKFGLGTTFILGRDDKRPSTYDKFTWEFAGLFQVGLAYQF